MLLIYTILTFWYKGLIQFKELIYGFLDWHIIPKYILENIQNNLGHKDLIFSEQSMLIFLASNI